MIPNSYVGTVFSFWTSIETAGKKSNTADIAPHNKL